MVPEFIPKGYLDRKTFYPWLAPVVRHWVELAMRRPVGINGPGPIPIQDISAYLDEVGMAANREEDFRLLLYMDSVWLQGVGEGLGKSVE